MANAIHSTALVSPKAELGDGNTIGPFVEISDHVVLGNDNWIGTGAVIGAAPEVRSWDLAATHEGDATGHSLFVGDHNVFREYVQIHRGWRASTVLGNDLFLMNQVYVAHDCELGDGVTMASSVLLAGHVVIGAHGNLGMGASVHQRTHIGGGAMIGMGSVVTRDVPPYAKAYGNPARVVGINQVGMERSGLPREAIDVLALAYQTPQVDADSLAAIAVSFPPLASSITAWLNDPN